jgi:hypothetical protein
MPAASCASVIMFPLVNNIARQVLTGVSLSGRTRGKETAIPAPHHRPGYNCLWLSLAIWLLNYLQLFRRNLVHCPAGEYDCCVDGAGKHNAGYGDPWRWLPMHLYPWPGFVASFPLLHAAHANFRANPPGNFAHFRQLSSTHDARLRHGRAFLGSIPASSYSVLAEAAAKSLLWLRSVGRKLLAAALARFHPSTSWL